MDIRILTIVWALRSPWARGTSMHWSKRPIHLILLLVIFFFIPRSKGSSKVHMWKVWRSSRRPNNGGGEHPIIILPAEHRIEIEKYREVNYFYADTIEFVAGNRRKLFVTPLRLLFRLYLCLSFCVSLCVFICLCLCLSLSFE